MISYSRLILLMGFLPVAFCSCKKKELHSTKDFNELLSKTENGFKQSKSVNGILVTAIYTPPEYVALKKMEETGVKTEKEYDRLLQENKLSASFIIAFAPDESQGNSNDVMYDGIKNFKEYVERSLTLNFDLENTVELKANNQIYVPVLSSLENTYGLSKDRKVNLAFAPVADKNELAQAKDFDLVYNDETFGVGTLHFYFDKKQLEQELPQIAIKN